MVDLVGSRLVASGHVGNLTCQQPSAVTCLIAWSTPAFQLRGAVWKAGDASLAGGPVVCRVTTAQEGGGGRDSVEGAVISVPRAPPATPAHPPPR